MSFSIVEKWVGRNRGAAGTHREYLVTHNADGGATDENAATTALFNWLDPLDGNSGYANTPGIDLNYRQYDIKCKEISGTSPIAFDGTADWKYVLQTVAGGKVVPNEPKNTGEITFTYNASAKGGHIISSQLTVLAMSVRYELNRAAGSPYEGKWPAATVNDFLNFNGHINAVKKDKGYDYKGIDLSPPPSSFEINWAVPNSVNITSFQKDIMRWVGTTNLVPFTLFGEEFKTGELFLSSLTGTKRTDQDWEVDFSFAFERDRHDNTDDDPPGEDERIPIYGGWLKVPMYPFDYMWIYDIKAWNPIAKQYDDPGAMAGVYTERVWDTKDWTQTSLNLLQSLTLS